ncbi:hypothetical protein FIU88_13760 [Halomonas sp. THAF12]|nr:hypothetical protein FIU88_13760 [Halomonas sp. THAF12]
MVQFMYMLYPMVANASGTADADRIHPAGRQAGGWAEGGERLVGLGASRASG